jgi:RHS repeat-associated protein
MAASSMISSNALNFLSAVNSGVDPRTGLYRVSINLPEIQSNELRGPGLALGLAYSVLNKEDDGYGVGWNLQLTQYNLGSPGHPVITLSTGESLAVTSEEEQGNRWRLYMAEQKLDGFHFYREKTLSGADQYRVIHKSGKVEILTRLSSSNFALPTQILSPTGHRLRLQYGVPTSTRMILLDVTDDKDTVVLSVERPNSTLGYNIKVHPAGGPGGVPIAEYVVTMNAIGQVTSIQLPGEETGRWVFDYGETIRGYQCIRAVTTPLGAQETVTYGDGGHPFPQAKHLPLPRVTKHVIAPGFDQPDIEVTYTYRNKDNKEYNFLGNGVGLAWVDNGLDNLYQYNQPYEYACVETIRAGDTVRSVRRSFNRIHLLTEEETTQGDTVQTVTTEYGFDPTKIFVDQLAHCQLPVQVNTTWKVISTGTERSEVVTSTYYEDGNIKTKTLANGVQEKSEWYPATASDGCPADPEGFVRQLKQKTIVPAGSGTAPVLATLYTYKALRPVALVPGSDMTTWATLLSERLVQDPEGAKLELQRIVFTHIDTVSVPFDHGRPASQATTLFAPVTRAPLTTTVAYEYKKERNSNLALYVQRTTETVHNSFDATRKSIQRENALLTGNEVTNKVDNVEIEYGYDALSRRTYETVSPYVAQFKASRQYQYKMLPRPGGPAQQLHGVVTETDVKGVTTRSWMDGCGRVVLKDRDRVIAATPAAFKQIYAARYDAWNNLIETTETDWWAGVELRLKTSYAYDEWGQLYCTTGPDGVRSFTHTDPVGIITPPGPVQRTWQVGPVADPMVTGTTETRLNLFSKPAEIRQYAAGEDLDAVPPPLPYATQTFAYDGLGRCTAQTDALRHTTQFAYDAWSRLVTTTLPNDTKVARTYTAHSTAELPERISVNDQVVGAQTFDGLGRLVSSSTGGRVQSYTYEPGLAQVISRTTNANNTITYAYDLQLTDQPTRATATDEAAEFKYDTKNARLLEAKNHNGLRKYEFNDSNQLSVEHWQPTTGPAWKTSHVTSFEGRPISRTDLEQQAGTGLATIYSYDTTRTGRLLGIEQGQLQARFEYDALGRPSTFITSDRATNSYLTTALEYDDYGREIKRIFSLSGAPVRTLTQVWQADGQMAGRHLQEDKLSLLKETFEYDRRGRLVLHRSTGRDLPVDALGRPYRRQEFVFDDLDNITTSTLTFADGTTELSIFLYEGADPCQLTKVLYLQDDMNRPPLALSYDEDGNQLVDEQGRTLVYDTQSRLVEVRGNVAQSGAAYQYDGHDHLVSTAHAGGSPVLRFYQDERLCCTVHDGEPTHLLYNGDQPLAQQSTASAEALLLHTNANNSVIAESQAGARRSATYSAYGARHSDDPLASLLAFNGEVLEQDCGWYLLGRGYRAYNPGLMRFHSPDSLSPFGSGGLNPYTYCLGNPIALRDPTGHESTSWGRMPRFDDYWDAVDKPKAGFAAWLNVAIGAAFVAVGVISFIGSYGSSTPASLALIALGTGMQAASVGATAHAVATGNRGSEAAGIYIGYAAMVTAVPGIAGGMLKMGAKKTVQEVAKRSISARRSIGSIASVSDDAATMKPVLAGSPVSKGGATAGARQWASTADEGLGRFQSISRGTRATRGTFKPRPAGRSQSIDLGDPRLSRAAAGTTTTSPPQSGGFAQQLRDLGLGKKGTVFETATTAYELYDAIAYVRQQIRTGEPE